MIRPEWVNILGLDYQIIYCTAASEVDIQGREACEGQIDFWTRTIRIYDDGARAEQDILRTLLHEVIHGIAEELKLKLSQDNQHDDLDRLSLALADMLTRNGWLRDELPKR